MGLGTSVRLPRGVKPVFPQRCVYSGERNPDDTVVVVTNSVGPLSSFLNPLLLLFGWGAVRAPVRRRYRWRSYLHAYGRDFIMVILVFAAIWIVMPRLPKSDPLRRIKLTGIVLAAASPWILFEVFASRKFAVTARRDWIEYDFSDQDYALVFAHLNDDKVLKVVQRAQSARRD